jgi:hypothetical protein
MLFPMLEIYTLVIGGVGIILFLLGQEAILTGLIIASVLQAMAFVNIGSSPILVYYFFGLLFILRSLLDLMIDPRGGWWIPSENGPVFWLTALTALAILGAFFLPLIFAGQLVYSPKLGLDEQLNNMTPLTLGSSHFNQAVQLLINALIFIMIWFKRISPPSLIKAIMKGFWIAIFFALWQLVSKATDLYFPEEWLYTVEGWSLADKQVLGSFTRVNGTFLEPSLLSTYLIGMFAFLLTLWTKRPSLGLLMSVFFTVAVMLITTSSTAYLGLLSVTFFVLLIFGSGQLLSGGSVNQTLVVILGLIVTVVVLVALVAFTSSEARDLIYLILFEKTEGDSFRVRFDSDLQSVRILWESYGLGVGLGSNRPSSFLMFLLSNLGIVGFLLFVFFTLSLSGVALAQTKQSGDSRLADWAVAGVWGLWATIMAKMVSQPDLSFSPLWVWIFLLASLCTFKPATKAISATP